MRKVSDKKKKVGIIAAIFLSMSLILILNGCGAPNIKNSDWYQGEPVYKFQNDDGIQKLNVDGVLYRSATESTGWLAQPDSYRDIVGYTRHYKYRNISEVGLVQNDPEQNFLYLFPIRDGQAIPDLFVKDGIEVPRIGPDSVSRIEYHVKGEDEKRWKSSEEVERVTTDPAVIEAFFKDLFNPQNIYSNFEGINTGISGYIGDLVLYSDQYPELYVPEISLLKTDDGRYFIMDCSFRWMIDYTDEFGVEISADVMEALIGNGTLE